MTGCRPSARWRATPTFAKKLLKGYKADGKTFKDHIDGFNLARLPDREGGRARARSRLLQR